MDDCTCSHLRLGSQVTESRNWNPDCQEHGVQSAWYQSDEQVANRKRRDDRLRQLQQSARDARNTARRA